VLDDTALVGRLRYVLAHGVKEGLVERSAEWPGLTCLPQLLGPARRLFQCFNWTKRWRKRGSEDMTVGEGASPRKLPSQWSWRWHHCRAGKDWGRRGGSARCGDSWRGWKPRLVHRTSLCWECGP
jgi:hypothetical protein